MKKSAFLSEKIIFLLIATALFSACAKPIIVAHDPSTEKILSAISGNVTPSDIVSASARIDLVTSTGHYPVKAALVIRKPAYLRVEILPPMGPPDFFLTVNPREMKILLLSKGEFYRGAPTGHNLSLFFPWQFTIDEIVAIFAGGYPALDGEVGYRRYQEGNNLQIEMTSQSGMSQNVWIGSDGRLKRIYRYDQNGKLLYSAEFSAYTEDSPIAGKISVNMADGTSSITVQYSDLKIEKAEELTVFDLPVPDGFKIMMMD